jgi:AAHS family 4-hydroxybenzoate transporter-like MFS transporter
MQPWNLKADQAGLLVSSGLVGFLIGAAVHGLIADLIGRRVTLLGVYPRIHLFSAEFT